MPDLLDRIGAVLRDHEAGPDAMRWTPERVICDSGRPLWPGRLPGLRGGRIAVRPSGDTSGVTDTEVLNAAIGAANELGRQITAVAEAMRPGIEAFGRALMKMWAPTALAVLDANHSFSVRFMTPADFKRHRRRCPRCNPAGFPPPAAGWYRPGPKAARMRGRRKR